LWNLQLQRVEFEVLIAVVIKTSIFWDITPCSPFKVNRHIGGIFRLHLQERRISEAKNQPEAGSKQSSGGDMFLQKLWLTFNGLHGVISQKIELFNK
jgi:hypothetical protein